ncbi:MAG TPA: hypothetical protein VGK32_00055 [Vicinamibacterales bacterium]
MRYRPILAGNGCAVPAGDEGAPGAAAPVLMGSPGRGLRSFPDVEGSRSGIG